MWGIIMTRKALEFYGLLDVEMAQIKERLKKAEALKHKYRAFPPADELIRIYNDQIEKNIRQKKEIEDFISSIEDDLTRDILRLRYLHNKSISKISMELFTSERNVHRLIKKVLGE